MERQQVSPERQPYQQSGLRVAVAWREVYGEVTTDGARAAGHPTRPTEQMIDDSLIDRVMRGST